MLRTRSREELENMLRDTNAMIAAHPVSLESVKAAHEVVENAPRGDREVVSRELAARNLPSLEELGKIQAKHTLCAENGRQDTAVFLPGTAIATHGESLMAACDARMSLENPAR